MVPNILEQRLVVLFIEGLLEPLRGWIKAFDLPSLQEAMKKARSMEFAAPKSKRVRIKMFLLPAMRVLNNLLIRKRNQQPWWMRRHERS